MENYQNLNEKELLFKIKEYDSRALEELYNRYCNVLFTLIKKIVPNSEAAENILVDVFSILWRKIELFNFERGNLYTWLINLARNKAVDSIRRKRGITLEVYDDNYENYFIVPQLAEDIEFLDLPTARKLKLTVEKALSELTDAQKYVIHLAYYDGYSLDEIVDELHIPLETIRTKVMTALHKLRENLLKENLDRKIFSEKKENLTEEMQIYEMLSAYVSGCIDKENFKNLKDYIKANGDLPEQELGELQNLISLIPIILDEESPDKKLKNKVAKKLISYQEEIKRKIKTEKKKTRDGETENLSLKEDIVKKESRKIESEKIVGPKVSSVQTEIPPLIEKKEIGKKTKSSIATKLFFILFIVLLAVLVVSFFYVNKKISLLEESNKKLRQEIVVVNMNITEAENFINNYRSLINFVEKNNDKIDVVNLTRTNDENNIQKLFLCFDKGSGLIQINNLPELEKDSVYKLWIITKKKSFPIISFNKKNNYKYLPFSGLPTIEKKNISLFRVIVEENNNDSSEGRVALYGTMK